MSVDRLTKLLDHSYLEKPLDIEVARAQRYQRELGFVVIQPDSGPYGGQSYEALKKLAAAARVHTRKVDVLVRWGQGILLILPETGREGSEVVVDKLKEAFGNYEFDGEQPQLKSAILTFTELEKENEGLPGDINPRDLLLERLKVAIREAEPTVTPAPSISPLD